MKTFILHTPRGTLTVKASEFRIEHGGTIVFLKYRNPKEYSGLYQISAYSQDAWWWVEELEEQVEDFSG